MRRSSGFSLMEVMVALGVMSIGGYFLMGLMKTSTTGQRTLLAQEDARVLTDSMASILADPCACQLTLGDGSPPAAACTAGQAPPVNVPAPLTQIINYPGATPNVVTQDPPASGLGTGPWVTTIYDRNKHVQFQAPANPPTATYSSLKTYGNKGVVLYSISIGGAGDSKGGTRWLTTATDASGNPTAGQAVVEVDWLQSGSKSEFHGPGHLKRYFIVYTTGLNASGQITQCHATALGAIAQGANPGTGTYPYIPMWSGSGTATSTSTALGTSVLYQSPTTGNIGLNTTNPQVALDVNGAVRAGSSGAVTTCGPGAANGEGSQRYNYGSHKMEYCNGSAWTPVASGSGVITNLQFAFTKTFVDGSCTTACAALGAGWKCAAALAEDEGFAQTGADVVRRGADCNANWSHVGNGYYHGECTCYLAN